MLIEPEFPASILKLFAECHDLSNRTFRFDCQAEIRSKRFVPLLPIPMSAAKRTTSARHTRKSRGPGYPVLPKWQADVKLAIEKMGLDPKAFAKMIPCAQSTLHDMLNLPDAKHSSLVPRIHVLLGWPPPATPQATPQILSPDALEAAGMFDLLPEDVRRAIKAQLASTLAAIKKT